MINDEIKEIKELGKSKSIINKNILVNKFLHEKSSKIKAECISSIGRMAMEDSIDFLVHVLNDDNPTIVLQAIRGLLKFKNNDNIKLKLLRLKNHPNEMIREIINVEFINDRNQREKNHSYVNPLLKNIVINDDVLKVLSLIKEKSFHLTFTSPPYYNARDYSIYKSYEEYLNFLRTVFKEVHRLTKNGRFLIVNSSPIIIPRAGRKIF